MAFAQLVRPGAPVVFGSFASSMSMQTGAPTFGTPEPSLVLYTVAAAGPPPRRAVPVGRLAVRVEAARRAGRVRVGEHAAGRRCSAASTSCCTPPGWLEGGLAIGYEKFVLDDDQLGMMATFVRGVDLSENGQALDAIRENGPGQHFLGTAHTLANFENAFYRSTTADNAQLRAVARGRRRSTPPQRANTIWKERLAAYEPPPIDDADRRGAARVHRPPQVRDARQLRVIHRNLWRQHTTPVVVVPSTETGP